MNAVVEALRGSKRDTGLDFEELDELSATTAASVKFTSSLKSDMKLRMPKFTNMKFLVDSITNLLAQLQAWVLQMILNPSKHYTKMPMICLEIS